MSQSRLGEVFERANGIETVTKLTPTTH